MPVVGECVNNISSPKKWFIFDLFIVSEIVNLMKKSSLLQLFACMLSLDVSWNGILSCIIVVIYAIGHNFATAKILLLRSKVGRRHRILNLHSYIISYPKGPQCSPIFIYSSGSLCRFKSVRRICCTFGTRSVCKEECACQRLLGDKNGLRWLVLTVLWASHFFLPFLYLSQWHSHLGSVWHRVSL